MDQLKSDLQKMRSHIDELESAQKMTLRELDMVKKSVRLAHEATVEMRGAFASIETHLVKMFQEDVATKARIDQMEARLQALEKGRPPAA